MLIFKPIKYLNMASAGIPILEIFFIIIIFQKVIFKMSATCGAIEPQIIRTPNSNFKLLPIKKWHRLVHPLWRFIQIVNYNMNIVRRSIANFPKSQFEAIIPRIIQSATIISGWYQINPCVVPEWLGWS